MMNSIGHNSPNRMECCTDLTLYQHFSAQIRLLYAYHGKSQ